MLVGPDQHGRRSSDCAVRRQLPRVVVARGDLANAIGPGRDIEAAGGAEARKLVIAWIQLELRDAAAYTADELAQLNAKCESQERFEPYGKNR
jgi:hypothetical protein